MVIGKMDLVIESGVVGRVGPALESATKVGFGCLGYQRWFLAREACKLWGVVGQYEVSSTITSLGHGMVV